MSLNGKKLHRGMLAQECGFKRGVFKSNRKLSNMLNLLELELVSEGVLADGQDQSKHNLHETERVEVLSVMVGDMKNDLRNLEFMINDIKEKTNKVITKAASR